METSYEYWKEKQVKELQEDYGFSKEVAELVFEKNWNDNHAYIGEMESCLEGLADFVSEVIEKVNPTQPFKINL